MRPSGKELICSVSCRTWTDPKWVNIFKDILLMPEIYFAGGTVTRDISSRDLINRAVENGKQARYFDNREAAGEFILANARPGDRIVIMDKGHNVVDGTPEELKSMIATKEIIHLELTLTHQYIRGW